MKNSLAKPTRGWSSSPGQLWPSPPRRRQGREDPRSVVVDQAGARAACRTKKSGYGRASFAGIYSPIGSVISCLMSLSLLLWNKEILLLKWKILCLICIFWAVILHHVSNCVILWHLGKHGCPDDFKFKLLKWDTGWALGSLQERFWNQKTKVWGHYG